MPRRKHPATKPAGSPTLPPPKAMRRLSRLPPAASIAFHSRSAAVTLFAASPSSTSRITHRDAAWQRISIRPPCSASTRGVVTTNAVRPASQSSSSGRTDDRAPSPTMTGVTPSGCCSWRGVISEGKRSDPSEVEQVVLGIDGEADALEKTFVAEEVRPSPVRADKNRGVYVEVLSLLSNQRDGTAIERSTKSAKARAEYGVTEGKESSPEGGRHSGLENTPGRRRVDDCKNGIVNSVNPYTDYDPRIRTRIFRIGVDIASIPIGEWGLVTPEEESIAGQRIW